MSNIIPTFLEQGCCPSVQILPVSLWPVCFNYIQNTLYLDMNTPVYILPYLLYFLQSLYMEKYHGSDIGNYRTIPYERDTLLSFHLLSKEAFWTK